MREKRETANAEDPILFHKNLHFVQIFMKKKKTYHAAAGKASFLVRHQTGIDHLA
ncbi:MAG: hypothetical protein ACLFVO_26020 [Chloroflexaceae bacterium]